MNNLNTDKEASRISNIWTSNKKELQPEVTNNVWKCNSPDYHKERYKLLLILNIKGLLIIFKIYISHY